MFSLATQTIKIVCVADALELTSNTQVTVYMNTYGSDGSSRPMVEGNWECSQCGAKITKLPFAPRDDRLNTLKCLDCFRSDGGNQRRRNDSSERKMFEGSWTCADCGKEITKMPFEPAPGRPIRCVDCYRASR